MAWDASSGVPDSEFEHLYFESPAAVIDAVDAAMAAQRAGKLPRWSGEWIADDRGRDSWFGGSKSWAHLKEIMRGGWPSGVARIAKLRASADSFVDKIRARCESLAYDVSGQWLDVGRFLGGEPECFGSFVQSYGGGQSRVVRVDLNVGVSGGVSSEAFLARGAAVGALCDLIECSGRRVEIYSVAASRHSGRRPNGAKQAVNIRVKLKAADEPLDFSRIAVAMAHAGFHRRAILSIKQSIGQDPIGNKPCPYRYSAVPDELAEFRSKDDAIIIQEMHLANINDAGGWEKFLEKCLSQIGVNVEGLFDGQ